ncbi:hypothetical protein [Pleionea sp. CnH1-48]|uniref:hypothetical protein n=1 Tax=Pleionea sp. CnH1-48 TaxID=2954494 RepID=UPI002097E7AF|nr:hypothetical protein [Pleionea sp. CnH1-48]MCO7223560.1 hypothetical protein [Pleionea sp. CnH1-48]
MKRKDNMPGLVYWGLYGIKTKVTALAFMALSVAICFVCIAYGFVEPVFFQGGLFAVPALWYWYAIKWVDNNSSWDEE